jgi:hypothetical protein
VVVQLRTPPHKVTSRLVTQPPGAFDIDGVTCWLTEFGIHTPVSCCRQLTNEHNHAINDKPEFKRGTVFGVFAGLLTNS